MYLLLTEKVGKFKIICSEIRNTTCPDSTFLDPGKTGSPVLPKQMDKDCASF